MERVPKTALVTARVLMSFVFALNRPGIIDQTIPARKLMELRAPVTLVPLIMLFGRALELVAGIALALGILPNLSALALLAFLVPATFVSHSFWLAAGTPAFQGQLINFTRNIAIWAGLLFIASSPGQTTLVSAIKTKAKRFMLPSAPSA